MSYETLPVGEYVKSDPPDHAMSFYVSLRVARSTSHHNIAYTSISIADLSSRPAREVGVAWSNT